eukprot:9487657-Pyramimonas_sp.AAC.1
MEAKGCNVDAKGTYHAPRDLLPCLVHLPDGGGGGGHAGEVREKVRQVRPQLLLDDRDRLGGWKGGHLRHIEPTHCKSARLR